MSKLQFAGAPKDEVTQWLDDFVEAGLLCGVNQEELQLYRLREFQLHCLREQAGQELLERAEEGEPKRGTSLGVVPLAAAGLWESSTPIPRYSARWASTDGAHNDGAPWTTTTRSS